MDLLKLIKEKAIKLEKSPYHAGALAVIHHIEIAEKHYDQGKRENDDFLYTDVIYRTNHAFEGILKVAYSILTGKSPQKESPFNIEKYLISNSILRERVVYLLTNYRIQWRNPSTHDYQLFFSEQEAFLAIVTICAFINILLDQFIEKSAFDKEKKNIKSSGTKPIYNRHSYKSLGLWDRTIKLVKDYSIKFPYPYGNKGSISERELIGGLSAFIEFSDPEIRNYREVKFEIDNQKLIVDMLLEKENERLIIEIKKTNKNLINSTTSEEQIFSYLIASKINFGILLFISDRPAQAVDEILLEKSIGNKNLKVMKIYPKPKEGLTIS